MYQELSKSVNVSQPESTPQTVHWWSSTKEVTNSFNWIQLFWILVQGLGSAGICFGINYGIGIASFKSNNPPTLWYFPLPIAGYYGVLTIIEVILNWLISGSLQSLDVKNGLVAPLNPQVLYWWPKDPKTRWWLNCSELIIPTTENDIQLSFFHRLLQSIQRSFPWILFAFVLLWPLFTGVSFAIWGNHHYNSFPQPEFMVATYGGVLSLITSPLWAIITLANLGERILHEKGVGMSINWDKEFEMMYHNTSENHPDPTKYVEGTTTSSSV